MLKFKDYEYIRPDFEKLEEEMNILIDKFENASTFEEQSEYFENIMKIMSNVSTMGTLMHIRYSINTKDEYYEKEREFFDENSPKFDKVINEFDKAVVKSKFRPELEEKWGKQLFTLTDMSLEVFSEEIIEDLIEENKTVNEYSKLIASAEIEFEGGKRNLAQMLPFRTSKDREMRKRAENAFLNFFEENEDKFDDIYDRLVKIRTKMAKKLGYDNYIELGYKRMNRSDYGPEEVKNYRKQIYETVVSLVVDIKERQRKRLGLYSLKNYDEGFKFLSGNPKPQGDPDWIIENGKKMYSELSPETEEFFNFMLDRELLDLVSKEGKMSGGYCTFINDYKSPFIFSNFNGTSGDVDVLTHEAGHAFQTYRSRDLGIPAYSFPTYEAAEIHSMSMEFITYPWMELFFKEDTEKYKFSHLAGTLEFLPYGVAVDEFQHFVYGNPEATPAERKAKWREIEKKYMPFKDYSESEFLERGGFWYRQGHIFERPFYYIDYTLAQVCAFQFFNKFNENREKAWEDYLRLCDAGGSKSFLELLELANLKNPFNDGVIEETIKPLKERLNSIDDSKF